MKFKIGDKVRIKEDLSQCKSTTCMNEYVGKEATVTKTYDSGIIELDIDDGGWNWSEEVLELIEESVENDPVNHPSHYTDTKIEVMDYIEDKGFNFALGNVIKYVSRAGRKDADKTIQDLEKANWYLNREIKRLKELQDKNNE